MARPLSFRRVLTADGIGFENYEGGHSVLRVLSGYRCRAGHLLHVKRPKDAATIRRRNSAPRTPHASILKMLWCCFLPLFCLPFLLSLSYVTSVDVLWPEPQMFQRVIAICQSPRGCQRSFYLSVRWFNYYFVFVFIFTSI